MTFAAAHAIAVCAMLAMLRIGIDPMSLLVEQPAAEPTYELLQAA